MARPQIPLPHHTVDTPVGPLTLAASDAGLVAVLWPDERPGRVPVTLAAAEADHPVLRETARQLAEYFAGTRTAFDLPLAPIGTDFQQQMWAALMRIPYGETRTYAAMAQTLGRPAAVRAVGAANGRNPLTIIAPCHRLVGSDGSLTGFAGGLAAKAFLIDHERRIAAGKRT